MNKRIADERLANSRLVSMAAISWATVSSRSSAICRKLCQNSSSRLMLVLWPATQIERFLMTVVSMFRPPHDGDHVRPFCRRNCDRASGTFVPSVAEHRLGAVVNCYAYFALAVKCRRKG